MGTSYRKARDSDQMIVGVHRRHDPRERMHDAVGSALRYIGVARTLLLVGVDKSSTPTNALSHEARLRRGVAGQASVNTGHGTRLKMRC
jgi:hypothetical protein